jgi:DNA-binding transcriptional regulator YhcF (GntR family)
MKHKDIIWRTLADAALQQHRSWGSIRELAEASKTSPDTTYLALGRLLDIGALRANASSGFVVVSVSKMLEAFAASRNIKTDTLASTNLEAAQELLRKESFAYALGGTNAAVHYLGGRNTVSDLGRRIVYTSDVHALRNLPAGDEVLFVKQDEVAVRTWREGYASLAQTYADLWASPGWQSAEFLQALKSTLFDTPEWDQPNNA